mgnify:CR=1 FL=1|tara:strand:- start:1024 stop:1449 length:426 start_codon:yes stop_codon:yes gene_type:complete
MINILILQGPNLNLLGVKSSEIKKRLTLGKLNKEIRTSLQSKNIQLKFLQTHKEFQCINFLQRNRTKANGLLLIPTSWAKNNYTILETIKLIKINTSVVFFDEPYCFGTREKESIFIGDNLKSFAGDPVTSCIKGIEHLLQ